MGTTEQDGRLELNVNVGGIDQKLWLNWNQYVAERQFMEDLEYGRVKMTPPTSPKGIFDFLSLTNGTNN